MTNKTDRFRNLVLDMGHLMFEKYNESHDEYALAEQACFLLTTLAVLRSSAESESMLKLETALDTAMNIIKSQGRTRKE